MHYDLWMGVTIVVYYQYVRPTRRFADGKDVQ